MMDYETFSTTADVGMRISGSDCSQLLLNAVKGLHYLYFNQDITTPTPPTSPTPFQFQGDSFENILVNVLTEIVYLLQNQNKITVAIDIATLTDSFLQARLLTIPCPPHITPSLEIKSVTYHNLKITDVNGSKWSEVIFDI